MQRIERFTLLATLRGGILALDKLINHCIKNDITNISISMLTNLRVQINQAYLDAVQVKITVDE